MTWKRKAFVVDQLVEIQREATWDHSRGWEPATYKGTAPNGMTGWHRVVLPPTAKPRYIDSRTGIELPGPAEGAFRTQAMIVPARRIREAKP